jgi:CheY-like chemotaxis protein
LKTTTVLLVEDSKFQKLANERMLSKAGYSGEDALRLAREKTPDIVLLDMLLPKLGGREAIRALRNDAPTAHIPVLVFSSLSQANELKLTDEAATGYSSKSRLAEHPPTGEKELIQLMEKLIQASRDRAIGATKGGSAKAAKAT